MHTLRIEILNPKAFELLKNLADLNLILIQSTKKDNSISFQEKGLSIADFSFSKSQKNLENYNGSLSDSIIEERQKEF